MVILRACERIGVARFDQFGGREPKRVRTANGGGVESSAFRRMAATGAPVAEMHRGALVGVACNREHRATNSASRRSKLEDVAHDRAVLSAAIGWRVRGAEARRGGRADEDRVVPRQLGDRLGQLLQPAVVGESAVEYGGVG